MSDYRGADERFKVFVEGEGVSLTTWQREWAGAYLRGEPAVTLMPHGRGAGKTFIFRLLEKFWQQQA